MRLQRSERIVWLAEAKAFMDELEKASEREEVWEEKRQRVIDSWRKNPHRLDISEQVPIFFEEFGEWRQNADKTMSGFAKFDVPERAQYKASRFAAWLGESVYPKIGFLSDEPLWCAASISLEGIPDLSRKNYERAHGSDAVMTGWKVMRGFGGRTDAFSLLSALESIADHVLTKAKGYRAVMVTVYGHYGPTRPSYRW